MSGDNYTISCPNCKAVLPVYGKAMTLAMTCPKCHTYFRTGKWNNEHVNYHRKDAPVALPMGSKGTIDDTIYRVMGFVIKRDDAYGFEWHEYLLFNPFKGYAFLSEYNGHWNFVWPIESGPVDAAKTDRHLYLDGDTFDLYQKASARVVYATGEFFFDVVGMTATTKTREYISPPYLCGAEESQDSLLWFKGEYITRKEVAEAFKVDVAKLPKQEGMGYTQPRTNALLTALIIPATIIAIVIAFAILMYARGTAQNKIVLKTEFNTKNLKDQKVFVTPTFTLEGGEKSLELEIYVPLQNDWFFGEFSLINETTGDEYNFTKEIEFYSGSDSDGLWMEGSTYGDALLSRIPGGRYHINIYPDLSSGHDHGISITVRRDVVHASNFWILFFAFAAYPAIFFYRRHLTERKRWEESDYSPYHSDDDE